MKDYVINYLHSKNNEIFKIYDNIINFTRPAYAEDDFIENKHTFPLRVTLT